MSPWQFAIAHSCDLINVVSNILKSAYHGVLTLDSRISSYYTRTFGLENLQIEVLVPVLRGTSTSSPSWISKFLVSVLRLLHCISEVCSPTTKAVDQNKDVRDDFRDRNESFEDPGRRQRRRSEELCLEPEMHVRRNPHTKTRVLIFKSNMDSKYEKKSAIWIVFAYPASLICPISPNLSDGEIPAEIGSRVIRRRDTVASRRWISAWYNW